MSTTTAVSEATDNDCVNGGEYCAAHSSLNIPDITIMCCISFLLIFTTIFYVWMQISFIPDIITNNSSSKRNVNKKLLILGYCACTFIYFRELCYVIAWVFWMFTFDYSPTSGCYILHCISHALWVFSGTLLYCFFIYRLYLVYNSSTNNFFGVKICNYIILIILNFIYFVSLTIVVISWTWYNSILYWISNGSCLILEIFMSIMISTLLLTPLLNKNENTSIKKSGSIVNILTKLSILSIMSLGTTSILRIWLVLTFVVCPEGECWLTFIMYATWSMDSSINIFCILCSFKSGDKYYRKYCYWLHQFIVSKSNNNNVIKAIDTQIETCTSSQ